MLSGLQVQGSLRASKLLVEGMSLQDYVAKVIAEELKKKDR